ncbi:hypothetical protein [Salibacterium halotolerans]|uniref:Uncharacterized protein n=1 Tax=Salibacterium halotolerans TaxID=1884432 RepID=A0A1I5PC43_9BACI|nr:hypothetical protein [Salibacterium halotolerans]SFP31553.1 hypothetical protein SAMN05518683_10461 [Salibacterium halotolerans]
MTYLTIKPANVLGVSYHSFHAFLQELTFREFIQFFLSENSKGENGMLVQMIRESLDEKEEALVLERIDYYNNNGGGVLWKERADQVFEDFIRKCPTGIQEGPEENNVVIMFVLAALHYVFTAYTNKRFRKQAGFKKYRSLKPFKV